MERQPPAGADHAPSHQGLILRAEAAQSPAVIVSLRLCVGQVKAPLKLRQVGVFLDMDEGQVTFYNTKTGSEIYSFSRGCEFTDRMFPLFGTGDKDVPLVLMTTQHHLV